MKVTHIVVHYSATYDDQEMTAADIDRMHKQRKPPFKMIGYHFFYRLNGMEEVGRPITMTGAHVGGQNKGKIGLCYAGGTKRETGPELGVNTLNLAQEKALITRIKSLKATYPTAIVCGHKDLAATQCPAFDVKDWWAKVEANGYRPVFNPEPKTSLVVSLVNLLISIFKRGRNGTK